jgi:peptide/nickel transport system substrate-binding protein
MNGKVLWGVMCGLMVLTLALAACGPAATTSTTQTSSTTQTTQTTTSQTTTTGTTTSTPVTSNQPKYGGIYTRVLTADPTRWDPTKSQAITVSHMMLTSNELMQGDWTKGPQGTGETSWQYGFLGDTTLETGELADSWDLPDDTTIIFHIHHGVKFQNRAPANGREVTAQDVVWNMNMQFNYPTAWQTMTYPPAKPATSADTLLPGDARRPTSFKALDKYTVEVKVPAASQALMLLEIGDNAYTNPPEIWNGTGAGQGLGMDKWSQVVGSGPFMVTNYIPGSLVEYTKNADYFETDPLFPGKNYKWPYIAMVRNLIIPDLSTRTAAFRVGKIDTLTAVTLDDKKQLASKNSNIQWVKQVSSTYVASGRLDKQNLPFKDLKVRQALNMAVDKVSYQKNYLQGDGDFLGFPYPSDKAWAKFYTPMDQQPPEVQQLFTYNPDKAKQLLKEAGYPSGFQTKIQVPIAKVDEVAILKADLEKVGVVLNIAPLEPTVYSSVDIANSHDEMFYGSARGVWAPHEQLTTKRGVYSNDAIIDDPYYDQVGTVIARDIVKNPDNYFKTMKAEGVYELASAWAIWMPVQFTYNGWWPWVKNYMGINWTGWAGQYDWYKAIWIDEDLKKSMGY